MHHRSTNGSFNSGSGGKTTRDEEELDKLLLGKFTVESLFSDIKFSDILRFGIYFENNIIQFPISNINLVTSCDLTPFLC
jgi:hypothetical protein